jgi:rubrerythrin
MPQDYEKCRDAIERLIRLEEKHEGSLKALALQAAEYERRLDQLNHAHAKAELDRGRFVTVELNDAYKEKVDARFDYITKQLSELHGRAEGKSSTRHLIFEIVTLLIAAVAVGISVYLSVT